MSGIELTHSLLARMAERTCAAVPDTGIVLFGLRGAMPMDVSGTEFGVRHGIRINSFNHLQMRCTIGQWKPAERTLALFPGSTVPFRESIEAARRTGGVGTNMLMLGRYRYRKGVHRAGKPRGHRAFRQAIFFPVWRTVDDLDFDLNDRLDLGTTGGEGDFVFDNLHCAFQMNVDAERFSGNGCQVVAGSPKFEPPGSRDESGPWARFIDNAYGPGANGQVEFPYFLFSGAEAATVAERAGQPLARSLRFGSSGPFVDKVQRALQSEGFGFLTPDGDFGRDTLQAVMAFQLREFGRGSADGIVGPNTAARLEIEWPPLEPVAGEISPVVGPAAAAPGPATTGVPDDFQKAAVAITGDFESEGDPYEAVTGDFDEMGISCGVLQWNIGMESLQPMVRAVGEARVKQLMPTLGAAFWSACNGPKAPALTLVRSWQTNKKLKPTPRTELKALTGSPEMRAEQDKVIGTIALRAFRQAADWFDTAPNKRQFLWFFDLVTQNGGLKTLTRSQVTAFIAGSGAGRADDRVCDFLEAVAGSGHGEDARQNGRLWRDQANGDKLELLVMSFLRSGLSNPSFRHVVLNRKGTIAMGKGQVNGSLMDLSRFGL